MGINGNNYIAGISLRHFNGNYCELLGEFSNDMPGKSHIFMEILMGEMAVDGRILHQQYLPAYHHLW